MSTGIMTRAFSAQPQKSMYHSANSHHGFELTEKKLMHYLSTLKSGVCHEHDNTLIWKKAVSANVVKRR